jgi:hypothetical protein
MKHCVSVTCVCVFTLKFNRLFITSVETLELFFKIFGTIREMTGGKRPGKFSRTLPDIHARKCLHPCLHAKYNAKFLYLHYHVTFKN